MEDTTIARKIGGSWYVLIKPSFARHMGLNDEEDSEGTDVGIRDEVNKRGQPYNSIWKKGT